MATYWYVRSQTGPPDKTRAATKEGRLSNFGTGEGPRTRADAELARPPAEQFHLTFAQVLKGIASDGDVPWTAHPPSEVRVLRARLAKAWAEAKLDDGRDEYGEWWAGEYRTLEEVLAHADARGEWVVSVHETVKDCYDRGGVPDMPEADASIWDVACRFPAPKPAAPARASWRLPLGAGAMALAVVAIALWRRRRFARKSQNG
jgi:hypothetical protein